MYKLYFLTPAKECCFISTYNGVCEEKQNEQQDQSKNVTTKNILNKLISEYSMKNFGSDPYYINLNKQGLLADVKLKDGLYLNDRSLYQKTTNVKLGYIWNSYNSKVDKIGSFVIEKISEEYDEEVEKVEQEIKQIEHVSSDGPFASVESVVEIEKKECFNHIRFLLKELKNKRLSVEKAKVGKLIFNYILEHKWMLEENKDFKKAVYNKLIEFKDKSQNNPNVYKIVNPQEYLDKLF